MKGFTHTALLLLVLATIACKQPYEPKVTVVNSNLLVVEGLINTGNDSTIFNLSRTTTIANQIGGNPEIGATVFVESNTNEKYNLPEKLPGKYAAPSLNLDPQKKYRLGIKTKSGSSYLSDFVESKTSPAIDSISWEAKDNGLQIYANTHDPQNNTRYYRWEYEETWMFHAMYFSEYYSDGKKLLKRSPEQDIYTCWQNDNSSTIVLGSTAKLEQDVVHLNPVTLIGPGSEKVSVKYSILVKQYALTKAAFSFWEQLKKNTENIGSVFDAQPSQLTGNIHNVSKPDELVIGFISAGTMQQKRIFVSREQLPARQTIYPYSCSPLDTIKVFDPITGSRPQDELFHTFSYVPIHPIDNGPDFYGASFECADCTIRGTKKKPEFWP